MARVMIVDDAEFMRMIIRDILLMHGHEVVAEVSDGEEAIQTYLEVKPDLVLMDIIMPNMDGKEALQKLLAMDPEAKVDYVLFSWPAGADNGIHENRRHGFYSETF